MMRTMGARWEHFPHDADMGIRGIGPTPALSFAQAALAMTAVVTDIALVNAREHVVVECEASEMDDLLFDWLDAIVFEMSTRKMLFSRFDVDIDGSHLRARLFGEPVDREKHEPAVEIKGPTQTELQVVHDAESGEWTSQCIVDV